MSSLQSNFTDLLRKIEAGRDFTQASYEPIFYLVFDPREILDVKRELPAWKSRLSNGGWEVHTFSMAEQVSEILETAPMRKLWLAADKKSPLDWERTNKSLSNHFERQGQIQSRLKALLSSLEGKRNAIVLVTDVEALHPYMRAGGIEAELQGEFHVTTVFLYPGKRMGTSKLSFLGFYPEDGNYRSAHVGD